MSERISQSQRSDFSEINASLQASKGDFIHVNEFNTKNTLATYHASHSFDSSTVLDGSLSSSLGTPVNISTTSPSKSSGLKPVDVPESINEVAPPAAHADIKAPIDKLMTDATKKVAEESTPTNNSAPEGGFSQTQGTGSSSPTKITATPSQNMRNNNSSLTPVEVPEALNEVLPPAAPGEDLKAPIDKLMTDATKKVAEDPTQNTNLLIEEERRATLSSQGRISNTSGSASTPGAIPGDFAGSDSPTRYKHVSMKPSLTSETRPDLKDFVMKEETKVVGEPQNDQGKQGHPRLQTEDEQAKKLIADADEIKNGAKTLIESKNYQEAVQVYDKGIRTIQSVMTLKVTDPVLIERFKDVYVSLLNNISFCYLQMKNFEVALAFARNVLQLDERNPKAWYRASICYENLNQIEESFGAIKKALECLGTADDKNLRLQFENVRVKYLEYREKNAERERQMFRRMIDPENAEREKREAEETRRKLQEAEEGGLDVLRMAICAAPSWLAGFLITKYVAKVGNSTQKGLITNAAVSLSLFGALAARSSNAKVTFGVATLASIGLAYLIRTKRIQT